MRNPNNINDRTISFGPAVAGPGSGSGESELEKTTEDIESKLGKFSTDEEWDEYIKTQPTFEVKVNVKIDQDISDDIGNKAPVPKTTWAVSIELDSMVSRTKGRRDTIDEFMTRVFSSGWNGGK